VILYGRNAVHEALLARRRTVSRVWATRSATGREAWLRGAPGLTEAGDAEIERLSGSTGHQGVCAEAGGYPYVGAAELLRVDDPFLVALDEVQDPQNLGAICRTAEVAGATGVVICERRAAEVTPAVAKASAGAVEHLRIARVTNLSDFLSDAGRAGCWSYGAAVAPRAAAYDQQDYRGGVVLVVGSEDKGLRPRVAASCDALVALPVRGRVQSLNASAAAAVLIYAITQKRLQIST
jgi:23S rRNA (guanosine2251-2'-O)-methyltransferase